MEWHDLTDMCEYVQRVCEETIAVRQALEATRAEMAAVLAQARQMPSLGPCIDDAGAPLACVEQPTEQETALEVIQMMHMLLDSFPPHMQVKIVKALTAHTMVVVAAQLPAQEAIAMSA